MAESPSYQEMDRDMMNRVNVDSDVDASGYEDLSYKFECVATENNACEEVAGTGIIYLPENSCHEIFKHRNHPTGVAHCICINGESCSKHTGGYRARH